MGAHIQMEMVMQNSVLLINKKTREQKELTEVERDTWLAENCTHGIGTLDGGGKSYCLICSAEIRGK